MCSGLLDISGNLKKHFFCILPKGDIFLLKSIGIGSKGISINVSFILEATAGDNEYVLIIIMYIVTKQKDLNKQPINSIKDCMSKRAAGLCNIHQVRHICSVEIFFEFLIGHHTCVLDPRVPYCDGIANKYQLLMVVIIISLVF